VVTRSGGNEWHGDGWEFVRNRVFDSRPFNLASRLIGRIINAADYGMIDSQLPPRQLQFGGK
jgi:hypothetical protein